MNRREMLKATGTLLAGATLFGAEAFAAEPNTTTKPQKALVIGAHPDDCDFRCGGLALKFNASKRYTTDGLSAAVFRKICGKAGVPVQTYCNRADLPGGSTLGNISLHHVSVPTVDIGLPQLAMHSSYETAAVADADYLVSAMAAFYGADLAIADDGSCVIK